MVALLTIGMAANAMSYKGARDQALFLTDKMAYELGLTDDQYNACYEINLDYIMCVDVYDDLFGTYWTRRNTELQYVLTPAQYQAYISLQYFYRPISWVNRKFVFTIYNHYPKDRFFRPAPPGYQTYRGSNRYFSHSPYNGRTFGTPSGQMHRPDPGNRHDGKMQPPPGNKPGNVSRSQASRDMRDTPMTKKQAINAGKQQMERHSGGRRR